MGKDMKLQLKSLKKWLVPEIEYRMGFRSGGGH